MESVNNSVNNVTKQLSSNLNKVGEKLGTNLNKVGEKLGTNLNQVGDELGSRLNTVTKEVNKNVDNLLTKKINLHQFLNNKTILALITILLALYGGLIAPALPNSVIKFFDTTFGKIFFIFLIGFSASKNIQLALMISVVFVIMLNISNKVKAEEFRTYLEDKKVQYDKKQYELMNFGSETYKNYQEPKFFNKLDKYSKDDIERFEADLQHMVKLRNSKTNSEGFADIKTNRYSLSEPFYTRQDEIKNQDRSSDFDVDDDDDDDIDFDDDDDDFDDNDQDTERFQNYKKKIDKRLDNEHFSNIGVPLPLEIEKFRDDIKLPLPNNFIDHNLDQAIKKEEKKEYLENQKILKEKFKVETSGKEYLENQKILKEKFKVETSGKVHPKNPCEQLSEDSEESSKCRIAHAEAMAECGLNQDDPIPYADTPEFAKYEETLNKVWYPESFQNYLKQKKADAQKKNEVKNTNKLLEDYFNFVPADNLNGKNTLYAPF